MNSLEEALKPKKPSLHQLQLQLAQQQIEQEKRAIQFILAPSVRNKQTTQKKFVQQKRHARVDKITQVAKKEGRHFGQKTKGQWVTAAQKKLDNVGIKLNTL